MKSKIRKQEKLLQLATVKFEASLDVINDSRNSKIENSDQSRDDISELPSPKKVSGKKIKKSAFTFGNTNHTVSNRVQGKDKLTNLFFDLSRKFTTEDILDQFEKMASKLNRFLMCKSTQLVVLDKIHLSNLLTLPK